MNYSPLHIVLPVMAIILRNIAVVLRETNSPETAFFAFLFDLTTGAILIYVIYDLFLKKEQKPLETKPVEVKQEKQRDISKEIKRPKRINLYRPKIIKMDTCSKNDLLSIDGFDDEKAEKFLEERKKGKIYYDIDTFVQDYELQPHQMIEVQDKLVFPPKPNNKMGRKIEF